VDDRERFEEIDRLFAELHGVRPEDRGRRLSELCGDETIREEVLSLFEFDSETAIGGIERAMERSLPVSGGLPAIDGIEVREVLGAGAMGVVYRAEQSMPRREVAVKVMGVGLGTTGHSRRFRSEADALARLDHPGIAKVFQSGVADVGRTQRPYLVMELVEGQRLDRWLEHRRLSVRELLELMIQICDAVQHAHARGVIHRDLKPSNILIRAADAQPKIIDFGVARITDMSGATMATAAGEVVGTLAYMSPEQLGGDPSAVDTRSDVYALGVILFRSLSGELPLDVSSLSLTEAARAIQRDAPRRLASIDAALRGDLDTIVAHALEKDKERRYQTAEALKADLERFLDHQPISARPPSTVYLLSRLAKRHRGPVVVGGVVAIGLLAAGAIATRSAVVAGRALSESREAQARLENINAFLTNDLLAAGHSINLGINARIVDAIGMALPRIGERFKGDPIGEASVRRTVAYMLAESSRHDDALEQFDLAVEALERGGLEDHREMVAILSARSNVLSFAGHAEASERAGRAAFELAQKIGLSEDDPVRTEAASNLGSALQTLGRYDQAEPLIRQAIAQRLAQGDTEELLPLYTQLYQMSTVLGRKAERAELADLIIENARLQDNPSARIMGTRFEASKHREAGEFDLALEASLRGLEVARTSVDPGALVYRFALVQAADDYAVLERHDEAIEHALEAHVLFRRAYGAHHYEVERLTGYIARLFDAAGREGEATEWSVRQMILRYYIAGPGEMESLQKTALDGSELLGSDEAFFSRLLDEAAVIPEGSDQRPAYLANVGRVLAERDDPRAEGLLEDSFESLDLESEVQRPEDVIARLEGSLPDFLERAGRAEEAARWRRRLDEASRGLPEPSQKN